jgi:uncharacterized protein (DUF952 family)
MKILHITTADDWEAAEDAGELTTPSLEEEGFIHCSTAEQVEETANRIFEGSGDLLLLEVETDALTSELKWERATDVGDDFPHIYGPLNVDAVVGTIDLPMEAGGSYSFNNSRSSGE